MNFKKKYLELASDFVFFAFIFFVTRIPLQDYDIWFHIKSGEVFSKLGIIHHDVFSYAAGPTREWFPYEWLFQIIVYYWQQILGLYSLPYLTGIVVTIMVFALWSILTKVLDLNRYLSYAVSFFFLVSIYELIAARPHIFAYTFLLTNLFLILLYYKKNKNYLWATIPVTLAWDNLHGSIFLDVALFGAYATLSLVNALTEELSSRPKLSSKVIKSEWFGKFKTLSIFTIGTFVLTLLPPLWLDQYKLLWIFFTNNNFISKYIAEWVPLGYNAFSFYFFTISFILVVTFITFVVWKTKSFKDSFWGLPLLIFPISAYSASRNIFLAYISLALFIGWGLSKIKISSLGKIAKLSLYSLIALFVGIHIYFFLSKLRPERMYYPEQAVKFIKDYKLEGHMFNEYAYGGYMLYYLYPEQKVFFDGRTDVYLCCEMRDTFDMTTKKNLSDAQYKKYLNWLWNKYDVSYVVMRTQKNTVLRKASRILTADKDWSLVFWDDNTQIFMRHDGKNNEVLNKFATHAATPYEQDPYIPKEEQKALFEYQRMIEVADSAKSRNTIGYIYLKEKKFNDAAQEFSRAIELDPTNESPYMNLAELSAYDQNYGQAIAYYEKARELAPDRGLVYIRLGQLYIQNQNDVEKAKEIWQEGINNTIDEKAKKELENLLSK